MESFDIAIVGGGPAGLTAAIYALRDNKNVLLLERESVGGQITNSQRVNNIPGFQEISGTDYIHKLMDQINNIAIGKFSLLEYTTVLDIVKDVTDNDFIIDTEYFGLKQRYRAKKMVLASGTTHRLLGVPGERELIGKGLSFCSTCDGPFYKGKTVAIIGGGNSAITEAIDVAKYAADVYIFQNLSKLTASEDLLKELRTLENVHVVTNTIVTGFVKNKRIIINMETDGEKTAVCVDGVFIAIGLVPQNIYAKNVVELSSSGYILSCIDGVYAAGDCTNNDYNQVVIACGSGAMAAMAACKSLTKTNN